MDVDDEMDFENLDMMTTNSGTPTVRMPIEGGDPLIQSGRMDALELADESRCPSCGSESPVAWLERFEAEEKASAARHALRVEAIGGLITPEEALAELAELNLTASWICPI